MDAHRRVGDSTRDTYVGYIERTILPTLGGVAISKLSTRMLETFYAELLRCRPRCNGRPFIEHRADGEHDCAQAGCSSHVCRPMAASTVRQAHAVISGALSAAVRWGLDRDESRAWRSAARHVVYSSGTDGYRPVGWVRGLPGTGR